MNKFFRIGLPLFIVGAALLGALVMINSRRAPERRETAAAPPLVRVQEIELGPIALVVESQGTVSPRTESMLVPEVAGRLTWVSSSFASGGFFERGAVLVRLDPHDYREALVRARAVVAQSELRLAQERAEAEIAHREWDALQGGVAQPLTLREPQLAEAQAALDAALAAETGAARDLERTEIRAPYAGRIRSKQVDLGQYVAPGTPLATIYAVDFAEIRLPLVADDLAFLDLPLDYRGETETRSGPRVTLSADFAGRISSWDGTIVRTEGEIDPRSRMIHAVARVADPYARGADRDRPPLAVGMFVAAEIEGRSVGGVALLPRSAERGDGRLLLVDDTDRLRFRDVKVLRRTREEIIVESGLVEGERVCLTPLAAVTDGMRVRTGDGAS